MNKHVLHELDWMMVEGQEQRGKKVGKNSYKMFVTTYYRTFYGLYSSVSSERLFASQGKVSGERR